MSTTTEDQATAYRYLEEAGLAIEAGNISAGAVLLYNSIEHTMSCLARERGLPHKTRQDLSAFASILDEEHESQHLHFVNFASASALRDNVVHNFADQEDLMLSRPDLEEFLDLLMSYWKQGEDSLGAKVGSKTPAAHRHQFPA